MGPVPVPLTIYLPWSEQGLLRQAGHGGTPGSAAPQLSRLDPRAGRTHSLSLWRVVRLPGWVRGCRHSQGAS